MTKKSEAKAGQRRKARAPVVSEKGLKLHKEAISDRELWQLNNRLEELERLRKEGVLNTPFIALEALGALSQGLISGRTEAQLRTVWPKDWGTETVAVPLALLLALHDAWSNYKKAPTGKTLGETFEIEGGKQGKRPMKSKLATIDNARKLASEVEVFYYQIDPEQSDIRLQDVIHAVATKNQVSFETVKEAHKQHRDYIRSVLTDLEVLKGVKSTGS